MNKISFNIHVFMTLIIMVFTLNTTVFAKTNETSNNWQHKAILYGWFPDIDGTLNLDIPGMGSSISADASDLVDSADMIFMGAYEGRKDKWSFKADVLYLDLSNSKKSSLEIPVGQGAQQIDVAANLSMKATILGFYGGYNVLQTPKATLDVMAGLRYLDVDANVKVDSSAPLPPTIPSQIAQSVGLWDALVGVKGHYNFNDKWFAPYHLDIGAGESDFTWQALGGVGYHFKKVDAILAYRHLHYDEGDSGLLNNIDFSGPAVGISYRF